MRFLAVLMLILATAVGSASAAAPASITVIVKQPVQRVTIKLVPDPIPEWGAMLASGREFVLRAPWIGTFPGIAIFFTVLGFNLLGDGLRDALDPRLR